MIGESTLAPLSSILIVKSGKVGRFNCGMSKDTLSIGAILSGVAAAPTCFTVTISSRPALDLQDKDMKLNIRVAVNTIYTKILMILKL